MKTADLSRSILKRAFGFDAPRPLQARVIDRVLAGEDALVVMPTGSGKSLCYQLPALVFAQQNIDAGRPPGVTLVLSPLIALMEDQVQALRERGVRAAYINSTLSKNQREDRMRALADGAYNLIYATPERLQKPEFIDALGSCPGGVNLLAVDEAHCISAWGHDLRPAYRAVGAVRTALRTHAGAIPPTVALTATATRDVKHDIRVVLGRTEREMPLFEQALDRPNLSMRVEEVWGDHDKLEHLTRIASDHAGTGIVYFALIKDLERMAGEIRRALPEREIAIYHGRLDPKQKKRVSRRFEAASPEDNLLVLATNAFGMGIDKPDIRFIVHAQVPGSVESYYQEIGRAGRDGEPSACVLLYAQDDLAIQQQFALWQNPGPGLLEQLANHALHAAQTGHADFDAEEIRLETVGKSGASGLIEYALIDLEHRGVIERTAIEGRYRAVRPIEAGELDEDGIEEKKDRDLRRLLEVVKLTKADDIQAFVNDYFGG